MTLNVAGTSVVRRDLDAKLTGEARYTADLRLPGMLHGAILRSPHPHADILSVDASDALLLPGVRAVVTPFNVPSGRLAPDLAILDTRVRFVGDEVAAVAADDLDTARAALKLVRVEYSILPHYSSPEAALAPGAVAIHPGGNLALGEVLSLERGSVAEGFAEADVVLEDVFEIPTHSAAPLEPRAALASWGNIPVDPTHSSVHPAPSLIRSCLSHPLPFIPRHPHPFILSHPHPFILSLSKDGRMTALSSPSGRPLAASTSTATPSPQRWDCHPIACASSAPTWARATATKTSRGWRRWPQCCPGKPDVRCGWNSRGRTNS